MPVELLISPPASGKTHACIERIQSLKSSSPMAKVWVIVPDSKNAAHFRRRLSEAGGGVGVAVGSFRDYYVEILERSGIFVPVVTAALEHRLVQEVIAEVSAAGNLRHYDSIKEKPGFILTLQDAFAELRGGLVRPERFLEYTHGGSPARSELAMLYDHFLTRLRDLNWIDMEGQSWLAIDALEKKPKVVSDVQLVVVDGFTSFTGTRRRFLELLSAHTADMVITVPGKENSNRPVHRKSREVVDILRQELRPETRELTASPRLPADILHLEQQVLDPGQPVKCEANEPFFLEVRSQSEEAREALRWIKALNRREGIPINACAIFAANLDTYQPLIRVAAEEFGMRVHFTQADPLAESPAILALLTLLSLPGADYEARVLMNALRSPYFDFGLDRQSVDDLERVSQQAVIVTGRDQWEDAWRMLEKKAAASVDDLDEERYRKDLTAGIDLPSLHQALDGFWQLFDAVGGARSMQEWVTWLEELLEGARFYERINSERDREACKALAQVFKAMLLSENVAGVRTVDFHQFLSELQGGLTGARLEEPREMRSNAVLVGRMVEARGNRYQAVALLGFSEGLFPIVENPDPFLDEGLRIDLGLEPRLGREQASIFYQALSRSDQHILVTRPYLSDDGETWEPSPYWQAATGLFTEKAVKKIKAGEPRAQANAASTQELLFWAVQQGSLSYDEDTAMNTRWAELSRASEVLIARRARKAASIYEGDAHQVAPFLSAHYSSEYTWSASRFEDYGTCPYKFLVNSVLKLSPKSIPEPGLDAAQLGSIYHRILELVYKNAGEDRSLESLLTLVEDTAATVFHTAPQVYGFRPSPLWEIEKEQMIETLRQTIDALESVSGGWIPYRFEQKFGIKETPSLILEIGAEVIRLRGVIDRVDRNASGELRVIDYKTGGTMSVSDLNKGQRLQLPIYALAASEALQLGDVVEGFYWLVKKAGASSLKLSKVKTSEQEGIEAAYQIVSAHLLKSLSGIRNGEFPPSPPSGGCPDYCPAVQWCWRYQPGF